MMPAFHRRNDEKNRRGSEWPSRSRQTGPCFFSKVRSPRPRSRTEAVENRSWDLLISPMFRRLETPLPFCESRPSFFITSVKSSLVTFRPVRRAFAEALLSSPDPRNHPRRESGTERYARQENQRGKSKVPGTVFRACGKTHRDTSLRIIRSTQPCPVTIIACMGAIRCNDLRIDRSWTCAVSLPSLQW